MFYAPGYNMRMRSCSRCTRNTGWC